MSGKSEKSGKTGKLGKSAEPALELAVAFEPTELDPGFPGLIEDVSGADWVPLFQNPCSFDPATFSKVMLNLIHNPNLNSSWLFRADILFKSDGDQDQPHGPAEHKPRLVQFRDFQLEKLFVRRLIPRNALRDKPLDQTCIFYHAEGPGEAERWMLVYNPHVSSVSEMPFYHPNVRGLAFLHEWNAKTEEGTISIHYCFFNQDDRSQTPKLVRTALHLLSTLHKHGEGSKAGYVKRVHHDTIVPQRTVQTTYARLKEKYGRKLIESWAEVTDPSKHVFEDLSIAAFLIELWRQMYSGTVFPGFVDIGCGNGLLVYVLLQEGYSGWGFDARKRKSWENYNVPSGTTINTEALSSLRQHVLLPSIIQDRSKSDETGDDLSNDYDMENLIQDGTFPKGTFIISNHADELTPWTPVLATASECPFIMIPCCSHDLSGSRFRAPPPKQQDKSTSAYSSLVSWVSQIGTDCGWEIETEMLRIPSTRNTGLLGRRRTADYADVDLQEVIRKYGGAVGFADNVMKLVKANPRGH
ncbi:uncharacterized protein BCR38DRAFT_427927 [Pseudomassariella vexata]|uniref:tRNA (uracil-O(2)-)-methyltransferase n=1 Tax=Pseudomassariella vexata TaxID=1141098 RepID=A0A1Y2E803_9PEZI|nr:uncharacterized protein BCR38DRAFT_427927 [Pseudomassariella vexata]ORY67698.1 hypothetical protein BCR38DRAFT_427927 [Pseudomassariella vexata]